MPLKSPWTIALAVCLSDPCLSGSFVRPFSSLSLKCGCFPRYGISPLFSSWGTLHQGDLIQTLGRCHFPMARTHAELQDCTSSLHSIHEHLIPTRPDSTSFTFHYKPAFVSCWREAHWNWHQKSVPLSIPFGYTPRREIVESFGELLIRTAFTKYNKLSGLSNRNLFPPSSEGWRGTLGECTEHEL